MEQEQSDYWNELGPLAERHATLVAAKQALSPELLGDLESYWQSAAPGQAFDPRRAVALLLEDAGRKAGPCEPDLLAWRNPKTKPLPELIDEDRDRRRAQKLDGVIMRTEAYWDETAPYGGERFTAERGIELLLYDLRRYQAAVARIIEKEREQKALLEHKTAAGQDAEAARQRWLAYLDAKQAAMAALSCDAPGTGTQNVEEGGR